ncbi:MAG: class I SAM-dependent methyltransferase [Bacteroidales bacterium]|jgi:hypothetical protein|nr:class I SAM-dependent methyltransferase [Bacteroidales bacterium]
MSNIIQTIQQPSEQIDLSLLTINELDRLHFSEEVSTAEQMKSAPPFSEERYILLKKGWENVVRIADEKALKKGIVLRSFGSNEEEGLFIKKMIHKIRQQNKKKELTFYEMGVGRGFIVNFLLDENNLSIKGCDAVLEQHLKDNPKFDFEESTIFNALSKIDDASIDIFYSNDVLEHICEDEISEYISLIYRKIADNGIIITITPNCSTGPHDVTRLFFPPGTKAKGFHFHEYSYYEVKKLFVSHGFKISSCVVRFFFMRRYIICCKCIEWLIEILRFIVESFALWIYPIRLRKMIISTLGCHISIFRKIKKQ